MEEYAISLGLNRRIIIKENSAVSTYHNLLYCTKIMNEHNGFIQIENLEVDNTIIGAKVSLVFPLK